MSIQSYINFNGNCREAVLFYAEIFKTEPPKFMLFGDAPSNPDFPMDESTKNLVMHTNLNIRGSIVMFSDVSKGMPFTVGNNISLVYSSNDTDEIKSIFNKLKEGGNVSMELQETFWSKCYGFVTDKFGIGWQLSHADENSFSS
ncbi:MAG TPA: VOC family protein [Pseudobacteroides sp.]|uniref:VOC family protein n=1 Tax=Pseudobacteroides sp. TaxID=1968840 RepID=UPI002F920746